MKDPKKIAEQIVNLLTAAEKERDNSKLYGINWNAVWSYCYQMAFSPYQEDWSIKNMRESGKMLRRNEDGRIRITMNLINEQILDMVSKETANPIEPELVYGGPVEGVNDALPENQTDKRGTPIFVKLTPDQVIDRVTKVLNDVCEKGLKFKNIREKLCQGRRVFGTMAWLLDWDPGQGDYIDTFQVKAGNKWNVVTGEYDADGEGFATVQTKQLREQAPDFFNDLHIPEGEELGDTLQLDESQWRVARTYEGKPVVEMLYPWQIFPVGRVDSHLNTKGWIVRDYVLKSEAQRIYAKENIYGKSAEIKYGDKENGPKEEEVPAISKGSLQELKYFGLPVGEKVYERLRFFRKPQGMEKRSQRFTMLGGKLVRAYDCRLPRSFDETLGIYMIFDRIVLGMMEAMPTALFMTTPNKLFNDNVSFKYEMLDKMVINKWLAVGGDPNLSIPEGSETGILVSDLPVKELRSAEPPTTLTEFIVFSQQMLQGYSADQFMPGTTKEEMPTLGQSQMLNERNMGKIRLNIDRDAEEFSRFYTDLLNMLADKNLVSEVREIESEEELELNNGKKITVAKKYPWTAEMMGVISRAKVGPKSLISQEINLQISRIMFFLKTIVPMDTTGNLQKTAVQLIKRLFELMDIPGVDKPQEVALANVPQIPGQPGAGIPTPPGAQDPEKILNQPII
ncbi:MAG: hypothetical protein RDU76_06295 [Candidatus Edwardsbacteria bacterium]|nr:hypothetical protein [Candidatus Edwardsbacteria bacterium]